MKSKRSSFNFHIALNDIKRSWPLWAAYGFFIFVLIPAPIYLLRSYFRMGDRDIITVMVENIVETGITGCMIVGIIMGAIIPMVVFGYLEKERSCYFYHSIPVTRGTLFLTKYITGFMMMFIPNLIIVPLSVLASTKYDYLPIKELLFFLLCITIADLFFYSFGVLCTMITGQIAAIPVLFIIFIFYIWCIIGPVNLLAERLYYGIDTAVIAMPSGIFAFLTPVNFFISRRYSDVFYSFSGQDINYSADIKKEFIVFCIISIVLVALMIIAAIMVYKKRKSEKANDLIAIGVLRPIFRIGVGVTFGLLAASFFELTFFESLVYEGLKIKIIVFVFFELFAFIGYVLADMLINKTFRVFKAGAKRILIFIGTTCIIAFCFVIDIFGVSKKVPDLSDVDYCSINSSYNYYDTFFYTDEDKQFILDINRELIDEKDEIEKYLNENPYQYFDSERQYENVTITYVDKKNNISTRSYKYPVGSEIDDKLNDFYEKNVINFVMGQINPMTIEDIDLTVGEDLYKLITGRSVPKINYENGRDNVYSIRLDEANINLIYEAYCRDLKEENISRYFSSNGYEENETLDYNSNEYNLIHISEQQVKNPEELKAYFDKLSQPSMYNSDNTFYSYVMEDDWSKGRLGFSCSIMTDRYDTFYKNRSLYSIIQYMYFNENSTNVIQTLQNILK